MDIKIITISQIDCPLLKSRIPLDLCRNCSKYRYETIGGYVVCNYTKEKKQ